MTFLYTTEVFLYACITVSTEKTAKEERLPTIRQKVPTYLLPVRGT